MKNADMPAMPIELNGFGQYAPEAYTGLTKREHFAAMAMQGIISAPAGKFDVNSEVDIAYQSAVIADALLKELDE